MITYGNIYLITGDFERLVDFYKRLLNKDVDAQNKTRYAIFNINGLCLSILNGRFDSENPKQVVHKGQYYDKYDNMNRIILAKPDGKIVINLNADDLEEEHKRVKSNALGYDITDIRYVNALFPYYYFSMTDPDGNTIEITGVYSNKVS